MMVYTQFLTTDLKGREVTALGSEGVYILDGRNCLNVQITDSLLRMEKLSNVHNYVGFHIMRGTRFNDDNPILHTHRGTYREQ